MISFARAIIANPSIFILDEATASIDTEKEMVIQKTIETGLKEKTSFIIAHRLPTIVSCDRILVIQKGQIVEDGTHESLLAENGYYQQLYSNQFKEQLELESIQ